MCDGVLEAGILESKLLMEAIQRQGIDNWDKVAEHMNFTRKRYNYPPPPETPYTAEECKNKYVAVRKNFRICRPEFDGDDEGEFEDMDDLEGLINAMTRHYTALRELELAYLLYGEENSLLDEWRSAEEQLKKDEEVKMAMQNVVESLRAEGSGTHMFEKLPSQEMPDYTSVIRQHIDLQTVESRIAEGYYSSSFVHFFRDLLLIFSNAKVYFPKDSMEFQSADELQAVVKAEMTKILGPPPSSDLEDTFLLADDDGGEKELVICALAYERPEKMGTRKRKKINKK